MRNRFRGAKVVALLFSSRRTTARTERWHVSSPTTRRRPFVLPFGLRAWQPRLEPVKMIRRSLLGRSSRRWALREVRVDGILVLVYIDMVSGAALIYERKKIADVST